MKDDEQVTSRPSARSRLPKNKTFNGHVKIKLSTEHHRLLDELAQRWGISYSASVTRLLSQNGDVTVIGTFSRTVTRIQNLVEEQGVVNEYVLELLTRCIQSVAVVIASQAGNIPDEEQGEIEKMAANYREVAEVAAVNAVNSRTNNALSRLRLQGRLDKASEQPK